MGKFKDKHGHSRWAEAQSDISRFINEHGEKAGPVLRAIIKVAVPRAGAVIDAISEVRDSKMTSVVKEKTIEHLTAVLESIDDEKPVSDPTGDFAFKKYITPVLIVLSVINYAHLQILTLYNIRPVPEQMMNMANEMLWTSIGLWQVGRIVVNHAKTKRLLT